MKFTLATFLILLAIASYSQIPSISNLSKEDSLEKKDSAWIIYFNSLDNQILYVK